MACPDKAGEAVTGRAGVLKGSSIVHFCEYSTVFAALMLCWLSKSLGPEVPVLETSKGCIFSSGAIARYISRISRPVGLYGQSLIEATAPRVGPAQGMCRGVDVSCDGMDVSCNGISRFVVQ